MEFEYTIRTAMKDFIAVYDMLADDVSKDIYLTKINYLLSNRKEYVDNIVRTYLPTLPIYGESERLNQYIDSIVNRPVILYGAGRDAHYLMQTLKKVKRPILFCDRDENKQKNGFLGYQVISPNELRDSYKNGNVVVTTSKYYHEIQNELIHEGFSKEQITDAHILLAKYVPGFYFDMPFLHYGEHEVFVDAGSYDLGTTRLLMKYCENLDKVYAFEPCMENFHKCEKVKEDHKLDFVSLYPYGTWSQKTVLKFDSTMKTGANVNSNGNTEINVVAIDDIVGQEEVTFIKMDVEGSELESLQGAKRTIFNNKPKLAISIYHKPEDMVTIPLYVQSLVPEYKFYIRHLSNLWTETVLYAVV